MSSEPSSRSWRRTARRLLLAGAFCASLPACSLGGSDAEAPAFPDGGLLRNAAPLERARLLGGEGLFDSAVGSDLFGPDVAIRTSIETLTITSGQDARYAVLRPGCLPGGQAIFEGYWHGPREGRFGLIRLAAAADEGGRNLCEGTPKPDEFVLRGHYGHDAELPDYALTLRKTAPLKPFRGRFFSIGHRGACENTDNCGASSNGLSSFRLIDQVGGNGVEMDVHITRDGVPVIFHDPKLSGSLVRGAFCRGTIADISLAELRANCSLENGELLPTLEEALATLIDLTELELVYLDTKTPDVVAAMLPLVQKANARAIARGRMFRALVGLPKESVKDAWIAAHPPDDVDCLLEYDSDLAVELGCRVWAPTWTAGPLLDQVARVKAAGLGVFYWTMSQDGFIEQFLEQAQPTGIVTGRAGLTFYLYQKHGTVPPPLLFEVTP